MHFWPTTTCFGQSPCIFDHHHTFSTPTTLFWPTTTHFWFTTSLFQPLPHVFGPPPPFFNLYHFFLAHHAFRPTHHDNNHHRQQVMTTRCVFRPFPMTLTPTTAINESCWLVGGSFTFPLMTPAIYHQPTSRYMTRWWFSSCYHRWRWQR